MYYLSIVARTLEWMRSVTGIQAALLLVCMWPVMACAQDDSYNQVCEIYVEATGNNKYEAKIIAMDNGLHRAFSILANKLGVYDDNLQKIPYEALKKLVSFSWIKNEQWIPSDGQITYSAVVSYDFRLSVMNDLISKYASPATKERFFQAIVIPVGKMNERITIGDIQNKWIAVWEPFRKTLEQNRLYLPAYNDQFKTLRKIEFDKINFDDVLKVVRPALYKKVVLVVLEYFTDIVTTQSYIQVTQIAMDFQNKNTSVAKYNTPSKQSELIALEQSLIKNIITQYGLPLKGAAQDQVNAIFIPDQKKDYIMMDMGVYDNNELMRIEQKLSKIKLIKRFSIDGNLNEGYKVKLYTDADMEQLEEQFYLNNLSYYDRGTTRVLIERIE